MLEVKANRSIYFDGHLINVSGKDMEEFLMSSLNVPVKLDVNLRIEDFIHILYDIKGFINLYCSEEYEVGRVLISSGMFLSPYSTLRLFKNIEVTTNNVLKINPISELQESIPSEPNRNVSELRLIIDSEVYDGDELLREGVKLNIDFTLLDIIEVIYEDFVYSLKKDNILV